MPYEFLDDSTSSAAPVSAGRYQFIEDAPAPAQAAFSLKGDGYDRLKNYDPTNTIMGGLRGAGSIGATLLAPVDSAARAMNGGRPINVGGFDLAGQDRRAGMDGAAVSAGADPSSPSYQTSKLATEAAGTWAAGGALGKLIRMIPGAAAALPNLITAIESGGMVANGMKGLPGIATRTAGGAINGAATAGLINPSDTGVGAGIGGALPGGVALAAKGGNLISNGAATLAKNTLGMASGVGGEALGTAYQAGKSGGTNFLDNMRGNVPITDVLDSAKGALTNMRADRAAAYRNGMVDISKDKSVIDFAPIDQAMSSLQTMGNYKGQIINKNASGVVDDLSSLVNQWKGLDPAEFHTPEGLDALKKGVSDIRDTTQFGTASRKAADTVYNAVKDQITAQAPTYAKVMGDYSQASDTLGEIERALSLGNKAAADTSMRKLQSLMRNNVSTNYGNRLGLAQTLQDNGAEILPAVAGQSLSSWTPRGLAGATTIGLGGLAAATNPAYLAGLAATSPRLVGELSYGLGTLNRGLGSGISGLLSQPAGATPALLAGGGGGLLGAGGLPPLLSRAPILAGSFQR